MDPLLPTARTTLHRKPDRGSHDRALVYAILDEGLYAAVGFVDDGQPFVMPMAYARVGDRLVLHGARASRALARAADGMPVCVTVTLLDGLVLARSAMHHSLNYRSVLVLGRARELADADDKRAAMAALVEHVVPGRTAEVRPPSDKELAATRVLALPIEEASAKCRGGGPLDDAGDLAVPCWAGQLPLGLCPTGAPIPDGDVLRPVPAALAGYRRGRAAAITGR
jgi:nitroimidazol reductase NimA-like FMN-containing flavoprotein (pyridoxamine 5'-phosphate oxidase superfamily)